MIEKQQMLMMSTHHVSAATAARLDQNEFGARVGHHGWCVPILDLILCPDWIKDMPTDLRAVLDRARQEGCTFVMLDSDGNTVEGLPLYQW